MKKMFLLFSHQLTPLQEDDARENWNVEEFIYLPKALQEIWSNIDPDAEKLYEILLPLKQFIAEHFCPDDMALIQGDFGATYQMVQEIKYLKGIAVYATTKRKICEYQKGGKMIKESQFEHRRFREYE